MRFSDFLGSTLFNNSSFRDFLRFDGSLSDYGPINIIQLLYKLYKNWR